MISSALFRQRCTYMESMEGSFVPVILSTVLMTLCRAFLSACVTKPDSDACGEDALYQPSVGLGERATGQTSFPQQPDEIKPLLGFFSTVSVGVQLRSDVTCISRNL